MYDPNTDELRIWQNEINTFLSQYNGLSEIELQPELEKLRIEVEKLPVEVWEELESQVDEEFPFLCDEAVSNSHWDALKFKRALEILKERQVNENQNLVCVSG